MSQQFQYSNQIRNWILQIMRVFSEFTVQYGVDTNGNQLYMSVPVIWGDGTFNAATILKLNSENTMLNFPLISIYINNLKYDRARCQDPTYVESKPVRTRTFDFETGTYLPTQANAYTVQRRMPVPYKLEIKVDIVTSNTQQKLQILEQILPLFNPMMEIQSNDNYLDWESLSYIELTDTTWSNRTIPVGTGNDSSYDVTSMQFEAPIWLGLPAKVSKMGVIFKVITTIKDLDDCSDILYGTRQAATFNNYGVYYTNGQLRILNQGVTTDPPSSLYGQPLEWPGILGVYGNIRPGVSEIRLSYDDHKYEITGTISVDPLDTTILLYNVDNSTLPIDTLPPINAIINPQQVAPGIGLPLASNGQSYLITANIGSAFPYSSGNIDITDELTDILLTESGNDIIEEWGFQEANAHAFKNDIITYDGNSWITTFTASNNVGNVQFVSDSGNDTQYRWDGNAWVNGIYGPYNNLHWRMVI